MHILLAVGVTILTAGTAQATQPALAAAQPITVTFVQAKFDDALTHLARVSGVTIEIDQTVTEEVRRQPVYESPITMRELSIEEAIATLTRLKGLSYTIVNAKMVRVFKKA
jgi:hypothetical protein